MHFATLHTQTAQLTFGHDAAQFKQLVAFLAAVSLVLWGCVIATMVYRILVCHVWYRRRQPLQTSDLPPP